jgi:hypothetical protein
MRDQTEKGSHRNFVRPKVVKPVEIADNPGDHAKHYQERTVQRVIEEANRGKKARVIRRLWNGQTKISVLLDLVPALFYGGCHGADEMQVFGELCQMVEEMIHLYHEDGKPLPPPASGRDLANRLAEIA